VLLCEGMLGTRSNQKGPIDRKIVTYLVVPVLPVEESVNVPNNVGGHRIPDTLEQEDKCRVSGEVR